jgi:hypothetical protein
MGNIVLVILFIIFRSIAGRLSQSQKTQTRSMRKTPGKVKKFSLPPMQDFRQKTTSIKESKTVEIKPDISSIPVEEKHLQKTVTRTYVKPEHRLQSESDGEIPKLFTQENILRGIILQEVLSPPKALMYRRY